MNFLKARLREPSTWAGLGLTIASIAQAVATKDPATIIGAVFGAAAALKADPASVNPSK